MSPDDAEWNEALDDAVIYQAATQRFINLYIDTHCGLSTFIPNSKADLTYKNYNALEWYDKVAQYIPVM